MIKLDIVAAFALLLLVVIFSVWYSHHKASHTAGSSSAPAGWTHYSSHKYGFQFDYPGSWGQPQVVKTDGQNGSNYSVSFSDTKSSNKRVLNISLSMDSEDYQRKVCPDKHCTVISTAVTSKTVQRDLKANPVAFLSHDSSSYGFTSSVPGNGTTLHQEQIVSMPAIKVSAATAAYRISNATGCPQNKFAASSQPLCINRSDYDTVNKVLKSMKAA